MWGGGAWEGECGEEGPGKVSVGGRGLEEGPGGGAWEGECGEEGPGKVSVGRRGLGR